MRYLLIGLSLLLYSNLFAQNFWQPADINPFRNNSEEKPLVEADISYGMKLDFEGLKNHLTKASNDENIISLPLPDGSIERFQIESTIVMESELAAKYSHVLTYKGRSLDDPTKITRFNFSDYGVTASITSPEGKYFISQYAENNKTDYVAYDVSTMENDELYGVPTCGVLESKEVRHDHTHNTSTRADDIPLRRYRLAISTTGEWGARLGSVDAAMTYIINSVNLMNEIFENELAISYVLVDRNDELIHLDKDTDPFPNTSVGSVMLSANTGVISTIIGNDAYDIGHVYNTSCDVGGIARLGSLCGPSKGGGVTCLSFNNVAYYVNVTAHEIGHQMSAQHTFNNCGGNESLGNGFEPGSGTTIMSYAGLCGGQNVGSGNGDNYYHSASLDQIYFHTRNDVADACAEKIQVANNEPVATVSPLFVDKLAIPTHTPFILEGTATDENPDNVLTYAWEQMNAGPQSDLGNPLGNAPRFRVFPPNEINYRVVPQEYKVMNNNSDDEEVIATTSLDLAFNFVVRDNNENGGTAIWERVEFETVQPTEAEGIFEITSFKTPETIEPGSKVLFTWNVSNTAGPAINSQYMDLYYSTLSGSYFDFDQMTTIAERIPNTGEFEIYIPSTITNVGRFFLRGHDNIYFDISNGSLTVEEPEEPTLVVDAYPYNQQVCLPATPQVSLSTVGYGDLEGEVSMEITDGLPEGIAYTFSNENLQVGETSSLIFDMSDYTLTDILELEVTSIVDGLDTFVRTIILDVVNNDHSAISAITPTVNQESAPTNISFAWTPSPNADNYDFELATSPAFGESIVYSLYGTTETVFTPSDLLDVNTVYFWRVRGNNECKTGEYESIKAFSTEVVECATYSPSEDELPVFISSSGSPEINVPINIPDAGTISDVNVSLLDIDHSLNKDLKVSLVSPDGTSITLFENICNQSDVRCGFDDESNRAVQCPLNNSIRYRPKQALANFMGQQQQGEWTLIVDDQTPGNGGEVNEVEIEICGSLSFQAPYLVHNELLQIPPGDEQGIYSHQLYVGDDNNTPKELTYTLTSVPTLGTLNYYSNELSVGSQFTQDDINSLVIRYKAPENVEGEDYFDFVVQDIEGGFLGTTRYQIDIKEEYPNSTEEISENDLQIYPIPAQNYINISVNDAYNVSNYKMFDINGRLVKSAEINNETRVNTSQLPSGIYLINIIGENTNTTRKVSIVK